MKQIINSDKDFIVSLSWWGISESSFLICLNAMSQDYHWFAAFDLKSSNCKVVLEYTIFFQYLFRECSMDPLWKLYLSRKFTMDQFCFSRINFFSLSVSRIHYESIIFSRIQYEFTFFTNILCIRSCFREYTMNSLTISRIYKEFTNYFANIQWIQYLFRECTLL